MLSRALPGPCCCCVRWSVVLSTRRSAVSEWWGAGQAVLMPGLPGPATWHSALPCYPAAWEPVVAFSGDPFRSPTSVVSRSDASIIQCLAHPRMRSRGKV